MLRTAGMDARPLILTLRLDPETLQWFDALRQTHFPPARNFLTAHLTMFHALPGLALDAIRSDITEVARRPPIALRVTGLRSLGRGVAYDVAGSDLTTLHALLSNRWLKTLTAQDRRPFAPHVTVQNKVAPLAARSLLDKLRQEFVPRAGLGLGLDLWHYAGGPWESAGGADFLGVSSSMHSALDSTND